jgi:serine/threonine-protein kinase
MYDALCSIDMGKTVPLSGFGRQKGGLDATIVMNAVNGPSAGLAYGGTEEEISGDMRKEAKKEVKPKKKVRINKVKVAAIILALICAIPVSQLILAAIENFGAEKEVTVPELRGMTVAEATEELNKLNLKLEIGDEVSSSEYDEGEIVSQDPNADMTVKEGFTITVNVSRGKVKEGTVPNVVNKTANDAKFVLESYGYTLGNVATENSDMPKDVVIRQTPEAGTAADPGSRVDIVVSL